MSRPVYLDSSGAFCAAGEGVEAVWHAIAQGQRRLSDLPCPPVPGTAWHRAFTVDEPTLADAGIDRKVLRTMEKQARMAVHGAHLALQRSAVFAATDKARVGLYLGLPVIDDPVPPWPVLQAMHEQGVQVIDTELCLRETPRFSALSDLNSSAAAHVAGRFGMTGAMGICSPHEDSGLQAFVEAALSVAEHENDAALAGAVSPKINPLLLLQYEHRGWLADAEHRPGEGAAFALLSSAPAAGAGPAIRVSGVARGFAPDPAAAPARRTALAAQALAMAGADAGEPAWTVGAEHPGLVPQLDLLACCGDMGPALPVLAVLLAAHGLRQGRRLVASRMAGGMPSGRVLPREEALHGRHALVQAQGPEGQCVAVVLTREDR